MSALSLLDELYADCNKAIGDNINSLGKLKNKIVYMAGGTGFVGIWVATFVQYLNSFHDFNIKLILSARHPESLGKIAPHLSSDENIVVLKQDILTVFELPSDLNYLIHAACSPDRRFHSETPFEIANIITEGTNRLLRAAERCSSIENFLYLSSSAIYGNQPAAIDELKEDFAGIAPNTNTVLSVYAESKRFAEILCSIYRSQFRLPVTITRPFSFVGPFQSLDKPWAINNFIKDVLEDVPVKISGSTQTVRTYLYGSDVAHWLLSMMVNGASGDVYNLGGNESVTVEYLAKLVAQQATKPQKIITSTVPEQNNLAAKMVPSLDWVKKALNLNVTVNLEDAVKKTIHWNKLSRS